MAPLQLVSVRPAELVSRNTLVALFDLTKPRLAAMSVLTALVAYATAGPRGAGAHTTLTIVGTTLAAGGALSLNQWWERHADALMVRTRARPLPQSQLTPRLAFGWSLALSLSGVGLLASGVNLPSAVLAAATILIYGAIYTPLKRRTRWATEVGAISGALPALLGNAAAGELLARPGLALGLVLLAWQMPHFFAIGWKHRADYRAAGFRLRPAVDRTGANTAAWSVGYGTVLLGSSLSVWWLGWVGAIFGATAMIAGAWLLQAAWKFWRESATARDAAARTLFLRTLIYLPIVMAALMADTAWR